MARALGWCWVILALSPVAPGMAAAEQGVLVRGRLLGADGRPLKQASASLMGLRRESVEIDSRGRFSIDLGRPGAYHLWLAGVHHQTAVIPLLVDRPKTVELEVRLDPVDLVAGFDSVYVTGDFNGFSEERGLVRMERRGDGTFAARLTPQADTLAYRLLGVQVRGAALSGTQADRYVLRRGVAYQTWREAPFSAVVGTGGGPVEIVFDPKRLPKPRQAYRARFAGPRDATGRIAAVAEQCDRADKRFLAALEDWSARGMDPALFRYDRARDLAELSKRLAAERQGPARQYLLLRYFRWADSLGDSLLARSALEDIPADAPVWGLEWGGPGNTLGNIARLAGRPAAALDYAERASEAHPDSSVREGFLFHVVHASYEAGDSARFARAYARLQGEYAGGTYAGIARRYLDPNRRIRRGRPVPDFAFPSLADSAVVYTRDGMKGRIYLIDFWATWCGPCLGEMENLHRTFEDYRDRGFTILSVSMDAAPGTVTAFRSRKWRMPWLHSFVGQDFDHPAVAAFEIGGIPKPILVDETGTIVAAEAELRGENLRSALERAFAARAGDAR